MSSSSISIVTISLNATCPASAIEPKPRLNSLRLIFVLAVRPARCTPRIKLWPLYYLKGARLAYPIHGQIAGDLVVCPTQEFDLCALQRDQRIEPGVKEISGAQVRIALIIMGINAGGIHFGFHPGVRWLFLIVTAGVVRSLKAIFTTNKGSSLNNINSSCVLSKRYT